MARPQATSSESSESATGGGGRVPALLVGLLALDAFAILAIWGLALAGGAFEEGLFAYQLEGTVPIFHLTAEIGMAVAALVGVVGWLRRAAWATPVLTFAAGMLTYGAVNALGWALHNDPATAVPMGITLVLAGWLLAARIRAATPRP
jgi:hypothetical protein